jgi:hypothetical protein
MPKILKMDIEIEDIEDIEIEVIWALGLNHLIWA